MIISLIIWLVVGAIAGYIAKMLIPGDEGLSVVGTIVLGIVGALVGGFLWSLISGTPFDSPDLDIVSIIVAIVGAIIAVFAYRMLTGRGRAV